MSSTRRTHRHSLAAERSETEHQPGTGSWDSIAGDCVQLLVGASAVYGQRTLPMVGERGTVRALYLEVVNPHGLNSIGNEGLEMNKILLGAVLAMLVGGTVGVVMSKAGKASGPRWANIGSSNNTLYFIDANSIVRSGSRSEAWFKTLEPTPVADPKVSYGMALTAFDCTKKVSALKSMTLYGRDGTTDTVTHKDEELQFTPLIPDSMGEAELQAACA